MAYWDGRGSSVDPTASQPVAGSPDRGWSTSFTVHRLADGSLRAVTKESDLLGTDVVAADADLYKPQFDASAGG